MAKICGSRRGVRSRGDAVKGGESGRANQTKIY